MIAKILGTTLAGFIFSAAALAADPVDKAVEEQLRKNLAIPSMNLAVESVATSEIPGVMRCSSLMVRWSTPIPRAVTLLWVTSMQWRQTAW